MRKIRFIGHRIIAVLKTVEAGRTVKDVCREAAISEASYYIHCLANLQQYRTWINIKHRNFTGKSPETETYLFISVSEWLLKCFKTMSLTGNLRLSSDCNHPDTFAVHPCRSDVPRLTQLILWQSV